ncbi:hypothetical protein [Vreelandella hamiltonii]|uniref:Uncharacterized protein n=1 Tax=Vreelandella hamiltonii TaxID=502829 RepID=A0A8H9LZ01_9GAMM|nr:hypothetical protein [Halomonas hamiltonii]GGW42744.1 hypothetical protein GCM10007157_35990 [Halomonas hamiltonii]
MSGFSPEYLADIEFGAMILKDCHESLNDVDKLLEQDLTPDMAIDVLMALGEAAIAVRACSNMPAIMPHDLDEVRDRLLAVTIRANHAVGRLS